MYVGQRVRLAKNAVQDTVRKPSVWLLPGNAAATPPAHRTPVVVRPLTAKSSVVVQIAHVAATLRAAPAKPAALEEYAVEHTRLVGMDAVKCRQPDPAVAKWDAGQASFTARFFRPFFAGG